MVNKRILIIGDANSFLLHDIVYNISISSNLTIDIINTNPAQSIIDSSIYNKVLYPNKIQLFIQKIADKLSPYLSFFLMRFFIKWCLKSANTNYDITHIHFFNKNFLFINVSHIQRATKELIITFWGSDFYKRNETQRNKMIPYLNFASKIIFSNPNMKGFFTDFYNNYYSKCHVLATGLDILSKIDQLEIEDSSKKNLKQELNINPNKKVITIGYSSHSDNHQVEIIEHIASRIGKNKLDNLHFVFPLTYGDINYKQQIIASAKKNNFDFTALTTPLSKEQIAKFRLVSEIMIHLRDTDQFSGSFQEYLYTNNVVITGKWLPYQFIVDKGIYLHTLSKLDELSDTLEYILANIDNESEKSYGNKRIIAEISHWNVLVNKHIAIYNKGE